MTLRRLSLVLTLAAIAAVLGGTAAHAGAGSMQVTVYSVNPDKTREMIVGATVSLGDAARQLPERFQVTNQNGQVQFPDVPAGTGYVVTVRMPGYLAPPKTNLRVVAGVTTQVVVAMLAELTEVVEIVERPEVVDMDAPTESATVISGEEFSDLPVFGRDYQAALTLAPGVQDFDGDGNPNVHGSRDVDFRMNVDGASNRDPLTGRFQSNINPDSIEEIEIVDSGADASYGGVVGGYGRIVTKSGGNRFEGAFNLFLQRGQFNGDGAGGIDPTQVSRTQPSLFLSGPVVRDRLWYMLNHEYRRQADPVVAIGAGGTEVLTEVLASDKLTWQVTPKNKLQAAFRSDVVKLAPYGLDEVTGPSSAIDVRQGGPVYSLTWTAPFSAMFSWEALFAFSDLSARVGPHEPAALNNCVSDRDEYEFDFGYFRHFRCENTLADGNYEGPFFYEMDTSTKIWTYRVDTTRFVNRWLGGPHEIKAGFAVERSQYRRDLRIRPDLRLQIGGMRGVRDQEIGQVGPVLPYLLTATAFYFPGQGQSDTSRLFQQQRGTNTSLGNVYSLYVSDSYDPLSNLRVTLGLRATREELSSDGYEQLDVSAERGRYGSSYEQCMTLDLGGGETCRSLCASAGGGRDRILCANCLRRCANVSITGLTIHPLDDPRLATLDPGSYDPLGTLLNCDQLAVNPSLCNMFEMGRFDNPQVPTGLLQTRDPENFSIVNSNIEPRVSVRWDPNADNKTVVSAYWGRTYASSILEPLVAENGPDSISSLHSLRPDRVLPNNFGSPRPQALQALQTAFSISMIDRDTRMTFKDEFQLRVQREIAEETSLTVRYINNRYRDQLQDIDVNHRPVTDAEVEGRDQTLIPGPCQKVRGFWDCTGEVVPVGNGVLYYPDGLPDLVVVNPAFNNIYRIGNYNATKYEAYVVELDRRYFRNWEMTASYVWSRSLGQAEDFRSALGDDVTNADDEEGPLAYDQRHVFKVNGRRFVDKFGGFRAGGAFVYQTGLPYSIFETREVADFPLDLTLGNTPAGITGPTRLYATPRTIYPTGRRNDQRNEPFWRIDVNLQKEFQFGDVKATFQADMFNLLNDSSTIITGVRRYVARRDASGVYYRYRPFAVKWFGRRFQIGLKVNF